MRQAKSFSAAEPPNEVILKAKAERNAAVLKSTRAINLKEQADYLGDAQELAAAFGWTGDEKLERDGIRVSDAIGYLQKVAHEKHVALVNPGSFPEPTAETVCAHLGITDPSDLELVAEWLAALE